MISTYYLRLKKRISIVYRRTLTVGIAILRYKTVG